MVLPELMVTARHLYEEVTKLKAKDQVQREGPKRRPGERLRDRDPWE